MPKEQPISTLEKPLTEKKTWVTPDVQVIESNEIMSGYHHSFAETLFPAFFGTNS